MSTSRGRGKVFVGVLVACLSASAWGHDWVLLSGDPVTEESPTTEEAGQGITHVYRLRVQVGQKAQLQINDTQGCDADIHMQTPVGTSAKLKEKIRSQLVRNQIISIKGVSVGTTTAIIPVRGEDVVNGNSSGSCREDTRNKLVVEVVASPEQAEREFGTDWRAFDRPLRLAIRDNVGEAGRQIGAELDGLAANPAAIESAMMNIYFHAHSGLVSNQDAIEDALSGYRSRGLELLSQGMFPADCEPRGFGAGTGGAWDGALRASFNYGFGGLSGIDRVMQKAQGAVDRLDRKGVLNAAMTYQPGYLLIPGFTAPSQNPEPGTKSTNPLQIQLYGGVSFQAGSSLEGCLWFGGRYDPLVGTPTATLTEPGGQTHTGSVSANPLDGTWRVNYDDLDIGLTYRIDMEYPDGSEEDSCAITLPWIDLDPRFE